MKNHGSASIGKLVRRGYLIDSCVPLGGEYLNISKIGGRSGTGMEKVLGKQVTVIKTNIYNLFFVFNRKMTATTTIRRKRLFKTYQTFLRGRIWSCVLEMGVKRLGV